MIENEWKLNVTRINLIKKTSWSFLKLVVAFDFSRKLIPETIKSTLQFILQKDYFKFEISKIKNNVNVKIKKFTTSQLLVNFYNWSESVTVVIW